MLAMEEFSHIYWPPLDPEQPFLSLARKAVCPFCLQAGYRTHPGDGGPGPEVPGRWDSALLAPWLPPGFRRRLDDRGCPAERGLAGTGPGGRLRGWKERGLWRNADPHTGVPGDIAGKENWERGLNEMRPYVI